MKNKRTKKKKDFVHEELQTTKAVASTPPQMLFSFYQAVLD
jgi:hypothetical protein